MSAIVTATLCRAQIDMVTSTESEENARRRINSAAGKRSHGWKRRSNDAIDRLVAIAAKETAEASVDDLLQEFQGTLDEFHALSQPLRSANTAYDAAYQRMIAKFLECYPTLNLNVVYLNLSKYSVDRWGPVYWRFFHLSAILLLELFSKHRVDDVMDYPTLLYNVDVILPCPTCAWHYLQIKRSDGILTAIKETSFARLMNGARYFHNLVTMHQNELPEFQNRPARPPFTVLDYAERYGCLEEVPDDLVKTTSYVRGWVDWQPPLHRQISLFYAMRRSIPYALASRHLKRVVYENRRESDDPTRDDIMRAVAEGMVGAVPDDYRETLEPFARRFYETFPTETNALAENLLLDNDENSEIGRNALKTLDTLYVISDGSYGRVNRNRVSETTNEAATDVRNGNSATESSDNESRRSQQSVNPENRVQGNTESSSRRRRQDSTSSVAGETDVRRRRKV